MSDPNNMLRCYSRDFMKMLLFIIKSNLSQAEIEFLRPALAMFPITMIKCFVDSLDPERADLGQLRPPADDGLPDPRGSHLAGLHHHAHQPHVQQDEGRQHLRRLQRLRQAVVCGSHSISNLGYLNAQSSLVHCREESRMLETLKKLFEKYMFQELESGRFNSQLSRIKELISVPVEQQTRDLYTECNELEQVVLTPHFLEMEYRNLKMRENLRTHEIFKIFNYLQVTFDLKHSELEDVNVKSLNSLDEQEPQNEEEQDPKEMEVPSLDKIEPINMFEEGGDTISEHTLNPQDEIKTLSELRQLNVRQNEYSFLILNKNLLTTPLAIGYLKDLVTNITMLVLNQQLQPGSQ